MGYVIPNFCVSHFINLLAPTSDQFCSLVFSLTHIYFTGCAYKNHFPPNVFTVCGVQTKAGWSVQFVLAVLPFVVRLVQSVRRYVDSRLPTHLINVSLPFLPLAPLPCVAYAIGVRLLMLMWWLNRVASIRRASYTTCPTLSGGFTVRPFSYVKCDEFF